MSMSGLALRRCGAAVIAAILSSGVAIAVSAFVTGLPGLAVAGSAAMGTAAGVLWILDGLQALRLREFLPWHAAWHTLAPAAPQPEHADA
jgi:hypothetical protein